MWMAPDRSSLMSRRAQVRDQSQSTALIEHPILLKQATDFLNWKGMPTEAVGSFWARVLRMYSRDIESVLRQSEYRCMR
jgi:hypothetical protein